MHWRKRALILIGGLVALLLVANLGGCAWRVIPPADVADPQTVYLSQYGRHTRLALPTPSGELIEYGFGEWHFYGLEDDGTLSAIRAITGAGRAAWSRRSIGMGASAVDVWRQAHATRTAALDVSGERVKALRDKLEARWETLRTQAVRRQGDGVFVARDPTATYNLSQNSNAMVADWLRELGCEVQGIAITSEFIVPPDVIVVGPNASVHPD